MKIGIITFHRASNYGAVLQCYALVTFLKQNGYDAEVVDYRARSIEATYKLFKFGSVHGFVSSLMHFCYRYKSNLNFRNFINTFLPLSPQIYNSASEIKEYDILVIGSDQVWNKRITKGFDDVYWGNIPNRKKIISYAASMGTEVEYSKEDINIIRNNLKNFNAISVREQSLYNTICCLTEKSVNLVLDPTFLLSIDDYKKIAIKPSISNYVLYYQMEYHKDTKTRVCEIARQLGCQVVVIGGKKEKYPIKYNYFNSASVSVCEFLGYIQNAKCVLASTFHGVAFSLIFNKDFYFVANGKTDRAKFLLESVGAKDRIISSEKPINFSKIDYCLITHNLIQRKKTSMDFLNNSFLNND